MSSVSATRPNEPALLPPIIVPSRTARYHPEDLMPTWKLTLQKVVELTIQIFVAIGFIYMAHALLPLSMRAVVLPLFAFGAVFASAFMFTSKQIDPETVPITQVRLPQVQPAQPAPRRIATEVPRGLNNRGNNCWINSLEQVLRLDQGMKDLFLDLPEAIRNFPEIAVSLPREILFTAEELAGYPITAGTINPLMPQHPLPNQFAQKSAADKATYRQKADREIFNWILQIPEFAFIPLKEIYSDAHVDDFITEALFPWSPAEERDKKIANAKQFVNDLRHREATQKEHQRAVIHSLTPLPVPKNPEERAQFRERSDEKIVQWMASIQESDWIPHSDRIFSADPIDTILNADQIAHFPQLETPFHLENATILIEKLREIALAERMLPIETAALIAKFPNYEPAFDVVNNGEKDAFIARVELYHSTLKLISELDLISSSVFGGREALPIQQWMLPEEAPDVPHAWFAHPDVIARGVTRDDVLRQISAIKQDDELFPFFVKSVCFLQGLPILSAENDAERQKTLRYLTSFLSADKPNKAIDLFKAQRRFFLNYENDRRVNNNTVANSANSQTLRLALHALAPGELRAEGTEEDPAVGLGAIGDLLPSDMKVAERITSTFETAGLPELPAGINPQAVKTQVRSPIIDLEITGDRPSLVDLWQMFRNDRVIPEEEGDAGGRNLLGGKGPIYPLIHEKSELMTGPSSLWICLKRFHSKIPDGFLHQLSPSISSRPVAEAWKVKTPVVLPDRLDVQTVQEGVVPYKLDGFIVHKGNRVNSGHYKSYTLERSATGMEVWYETNDTRVRIVEGEELARLKEQAYIPHYTRIYE